MQLLSTVRLDQSLRHNGGHRDMMWAHLRLCHVAIAIFFSYYNILVVGEAVSEGQVLELLMQTECRDEC